MGFPKWLEIGFALVLGATLIAVAAGVYLVPLVARAIKKYLRSDCQD